MTQATAIVKLVNAARADLWHTPSGDPYLSTKIVGHVEHFGLFSRAAKDYLTRLYYVDFGSSPNAAAVKDALNTLSGTARFDGATHDIHLRVAQQDEALFIDLCDDSWRAVVVTPEGWRVTADPPVRFRRAKGMLPLPVPLPGGSVRDLRRFLNVAGDDDFALVVCWLVQTLRPRGPYPVVVLLGEQGSCKSTAARVLRQLVDPNVADTRSEPREPRDLMIAADNSHVVSFDNVSRLPEWFSDALCRLATGGGFSTRTLYENREEEIFEAQRPVILNGISQVATRPDLIDRSVVLTLPPISDRQRQHEAGFWADFDQARPQILGALLDAVVMGLRHHGDSHRDELPRMADFAIFAEAAETALPWPSGTFWRAYAGNRQGAVDDVLDGDLLVDIVRALPPWEGTASDLLTELNQRTTEEIRRQKGWFQKPRQVTNALRRLAPALRRTGTDVTFEREAHSRRRVISIREGFAASPASPGVLAPDSADIRGTQGTQGDVASPVASPTNPNVYGLRTQGDAGDATKPTLTETPSDDLAEVVVTRWAESDTVIAAALGVEVGLVTAMRAQIQAEVGSDPA